MFLEKGYSKKKKGNYLQTWWHNSRCRRVFQWLWRHGCLPPEQQGSPFPWQQPDIADRRHGHLTQPDINLFLLSATMENRHWDGNTALQKSVKRGDELQSQLRRRRQQRYHGDISKTRLGWRRWRFSSVNLWRFCVLWKCKSAVISWTYLTLSLSGRFLFHFDHKGALHLLLNWAQTSHFFIIIFFAYLRIAQVRNIYHLEGEQVRKMKASFCLGFRSRDRLSSSCILFAANEEMTH